MKDLGIVEELKGGQSRGDNAYRSDPLSEGPLVLMIPKNSPSELVRGLISSLLDL